MTREKALIFFKNNKYILMLWGLILLLCIIPLSFPQIYTGHDLNFHLCRIKCISENISHGKWFSPIYTTYLDGYGYASPLFYGDVFLHIPGSLTYLGLSPEEALRVFTMLITALTAMSSYFFSNKIFKDQSSAFAVSVLYTFSSYFCVDMITRIALGELQAFIFLPMISYGFYSIVFDDTSNRNWLFLPIGLAGCAVSHVLTAVIAVVILIVFGCIYLKRFIYKKQKLLLVLYSVILFFSASAFFVFPLLEQYLSYDFAVNNGKAALQWGTLASRTMPIEYIFSYNVSAGSDPWIPNGIGILPVILIILAAWMKIERKNISSYAMSFPIAATGVMVITAVKPLWELLQPICGSLQFPWRLTVFATLFLAFGAGVIVKEADNKKTKILISVVCVSLAVFGYASTGVGKYGNMLKVYNQGGRDIEYTNSIGAGEYIPTYFDEKKNDWVSSAQIKANILKRGDKITSNNLSLSNMEYTRNFDILSVKYRNNTENNTFIDFPLLMYKGYAAYQDGEKLEISYGVNSTVRVYLSKPSGEITVYYKGTAIQTVSRVITAIAFLSILLYIIYPKWETARKRSQTRSLARKVRE